MLANFDLIKIYQKHLQFNCLTYPQIDWKQSWHHIDIINATKNLKEKNKVSRGFAEISFIKATRRDDTKGLESALQRSELYEFILRMAQ